MGELNIMVYIAVTPVSFLGAIAFALAYAAEAKKIKVSDISISEVGKCKYPSNPAKILGYTSALFTLLTQIAITAAARCAYRGRNHISTQSFPLRKMIAILGFILSWVGSIIGIGLLLYAANLSTRQEFITSTGLCYTMKHALFHAGGWMGFVACILGQFSIIAFSADCRSTPGAVPYQGNIAMENLQFASASAYSNPKQPQYV